MEWIDIKEKRPVVGQICVVASGKFRYILEYWESPIGSLPHWEYPDSGYCHMTIEDSTYWIPLPELPTQ